jgi:putative phosphoribosyl transferase
MNASLMNGIQKIDMPIPLEDATLQGDLIVPPDAKGLVLFSHGSGSSRKSPRNRWVAEELHRAGFGTLLFDLLTMHEDEVEDLRFDIPLLTDRLTAIMQWVHGQPALRALPIGLFGASTGAASALNTAAALPQLVKAVVSRGGRPDLAMEALPRVRAATLLIVGGWDWPVIDMNRTAFDELQCVKRLAIVEGATHLFEEPGKLEEVARLAMEWYGLYLQQRAGT